LVLKKIKLYICSTIWTNYEKRKYIDKDEMSMIILKNGSRRDITLDLEDLNKICKRIISYKHATLAY
jgi:hypothetical protein